ncbi:MAG: PAS domain S-box protein [Methylobacterium sp.]|uniref:ATP-binding protein n=1 Tax=Methylobacterium sp. TaxID=409 RepID=UPI00258A11DD|nr:ATP-binding protein [Methylobacterium sp.]MBY0296601.1 PAS domain S-box protein [Methylobacterium sp.]
MTSLSAWAAGLLRRPRLLGSPAVVAYLAAALMLSIGAWQIWRGREAALADAQADTRNLARSLIQHTARSIEAADLILSGVVDHIESGALADPAALKAHLQRRLALITHVSGLSVQDAQGDWISDSLGEPVVPINSGDRPYFLHHRTTPSRDLHVDAPMLSRRSGRIIVPLSRRWNGPDGQFGGVVVASLTPGHFQAFYRDLGVGERGSIALLDADGTLLVRHPYDVRTVGRDLSGTDLFRRALPQARSGVFRARSSLDGEERIVAYERLDAYPLVVTVARSVPETLTAWRDDALIDGLALTIAATTLCGLGIGLARHQRRIAEAEQAVRASEARFRLLSEHALDMIVWADLDTVRRYVSPASREVLGYEPEALIGTKPLDSVHPDDRGGWAAMLSDLTGGRRDTATSRLRYRRQDGAYIWVEAKYRLLRDAAGTPTGYVAVVRDVSERQRHKEALEQAAEAAEQASRAKSDFLASMSHEIRTPLNGILGYTELLLDDAALSEGQRRQAERIQSAGSALLTIVDDLLDFSKIEAGQIDLDLQPFRLGALIDNTVSIIRGAAGAKDIAVTVTVAPGVPAVLVGDHGRLRQILLNLLNNAVKFTPAGAVTLAVTREAATRMLRFTVADTGIGIPEELQDRLFQRFSQVDGSIRRRFGGTGLGLAISKTLVERMGGTIGVESRAGAGATFWFTVALDEAETEAAAPAAPETSGEAAPADLLLVEDLEINRELARAVLEAAGHRVDLAVDGVEAVRAVQKRAYDLVLMDVQMPGMDGLAATRHIRALPGPVGRVPIVAMTANVLPEQVAALREAGMDGHVGKPFKRADLAAVIARYRAKRAEGAEGRVDPAAFAAVHDLLGAERVDGLLALLAAELAHRVDGTDPDRDQLGRDAHAMVSAAGMLGFANLSALCREIEQAAREAHDLGPLLARFGAARRTALAEIARLRGAERRLQEPTA